jgi:hypothetical protein
MKTKWIVILLSVTSWAHALDIRYDENVNPYVNPYQGLVDAANQYLQYRMYGTPPVYQQVQASPVTPKVTPREEPQPQLAPFCVVDEIGARYCHYFTLEACNEAAHLMRGVCE